MKLWILLKDGRTLVATKEDATDIYTYPFLCMIGNTGEGPMIRWGDYIPVGGMHHDDLLDKGIEITGGMIQCTDEPIPALLESYDKLVSDMKGQGSLIDVVKTLPPELKK